MRRLLALIALFTLGWTPVAALQCEMEGERVEGGAPVGEHQRANAPGHEGHAPPHPHADHRQHDGAPSHSHDDHGPLDPGPTDCGQLMACGATAIGPDGFDRAFAIGPPSFHERLPLQATMAGIDLAADPPPPRALF